MFPVCCCFTSSVSSSPVSHRYERRGRRAFGVGELRAGGRPHRGLQAPTGSAGTGRSRNQTRLSQVSPGTALTLFSLPVRRRSSVCPSSPSRRNRDSRSAPSPRGFGAPSSNEPHPLPCSLSTYHSSKVRVRERRGETRVLQANGLRRHGRLSGRGCCAGPELGL